MRLYALFRLAFAPAPPLGLTSPHTITRRLILQKARHHGHRPKPMTTLLLLVSQRFQVLFHSPPGVLFTLPSRYSCAIGRQCVLSLTRWSSRIPAGLPGSGVTREHCQETDCFRVQGYYLLRRGFPDRFC